MSMKINNINNKEFRKEEDEENDEQSPNFVSFVAVSLALFFPLISALKLSKNVIN